jgi:hypothetical protein
MEPLDPVTVVALLAVVFRPGMASGAFSTPTCTALDPPLLELLDPIAIMVFLATTLRSDVHATTFLVSACVAPGPPLSEPLTCSMATLLGACCPSDAGSEMVLPSLQTSLLFFSKGEVYSVDAPMSLGGDREPAL